MSKGFTCLCGKYHAYSMYVFAHSDVELVFTCDVCGRKYTVLNFDVDLYEDDETAKEVL